MRAILVSVLLPVFCSSLRAQQFTFSDQAFLAQSYFRSFYVGREFSGASGLSLGLQPSHISQLVTDASAVTLVARVWIDPSGTGTRSIISAELASGTVGLSLAVLTGGQLRGAGRSTSGDTFQTKQSASAVPTSAWHTVATVLDIAGDTINTYLDGVLTTSGSAAVTFGASVYTPTGTYSTIDRIGNDAAASPSTPFKGFIADAAVFARALSTAEMLAITAGARPSSVSGGPPAFYLPLDKQTDGIGYFAYPQTGGIYGVPTATIAWNTATNKPSVMPLPAQAEECRFAPTRVWRWKASDASSYGNGNYVTSLAVRHSGRLATNTGTNCPTWLALTNGGALRFYVSTNQSLASPASIDVARGITVVALMQANNSGRVLSASASSTVETSPNAVILTPHLGLSIGGAATVAFSTYSDYDTNSGAVALFSGRFSGVNICNWLNGVKRNGTVTGGTELSDGSFNVTSQPNGPTLFPIQIGHRLHSSSALPFDGSLYDLILVNGALTDEEVAYLEGVMAWQDGFTDLLPVGHPWKLVEPTLNSQINYPWGFGMMARGDSPGTKWLGSPSMVKLGATLYATHDFFANDVTINGGRLYASPDDGRTWKGVSEFTNYNWGTLWQHTDGNLYILATTRRNGDIQIGKSTTLGVSWTWTTLSASGGPVAAAGAGLNAPNYLNAGGLPPLYHDSYIFKEFENDTTNNLDTFRGKHTFVIYAPAASDLTEKTNWTATTQMEFGPTSYANGGANTPGFVEGNMVVDDASQMWNVIRLAGSATPNLALFIPMAWSSPTLTMPSFQTNYIKAFPGGNVKFNLARHGSYFYTVANDNTAVAASIGSSNDYDQRDRVTLVRSPSTDLTSPGFTNVLTVIDQATLGTGMSAADSINYFGFQYPSFLISDGFGHMLYRVSWSGADSYHNGHLIGFGKVQIP